MTEPVWDGDAHQAAVQQAYRDALAVAFAAFWDYSIMDNGEGDPDPGYRMPDVIDAVLSRGHDHYRMHLLVRELAGLLCLWRADPETTMREIAAAPEVITPPD